MRDRTRAWLAAALLAGLASAAGTASATPFRVDFVTDTFGSASDPSALLPAGWTVTSGLGGGPTAFAGSWIYDSSAVDLDPSPRVGEFLFSDPSLVIQLDAGGIAYEFQLDRITFTYSDVPGEWSFYRVFGSSTSSPIPGIDAETFVLVFGNMSPLPSALIPATDAPDPLAGSPWEDGSGFGGLTVSGSGPAGAYSFSKITGSHGAPQAVVPEPGSALLFGAGLWAIAGRRSLRRGPRRAA
jgi:hypothetical protein